MKNKFIKRVALALSLAFLLGIAGVCGCAKGRDGKDGTNGRDVTVMELYEAAKGQPGNENLTLDDFLKQYLNYTSSELEEQISLVNVVNRSLLASVAIRAGFREYADGSYSNASYDGTGVIIDASKKDEGEITVVTNCHVVYSSKAVYSGSDGFSENVRLWLYGSEFMTDRSIVAQILCADVSADIAILKVTESDEIKSSHVRSATWASGEESYMGEYVFATGNAGGNRLSFSEGRVSRDGDEVTVNTGNNSSYTCRAIRTTLPVAGGNSGGGLFNRAGELVGIVCAQTTADGTHLGFALPAATVKRQIKSMLDNLNPASPYTIKRFHHGLSLNLTDYYNTGLDESGYAGLAEVLTVTHVTGAFRNKAKAGDVLKHVRVTLSGASVPVEDMPVMREHNFTDAMLSVREGALVELTVLRDGAEVVLSVTADSGDFIYS